MIADLKRRIRAAMTRVAWLHRRLEAQRSYSQEGEDRLLLRYFGHRRQGFYVDIGAHHPFRFSNTQLFYEMGWRGINIDAMPGSMAPFRRSRARDINLEVGVGAARATAPFFVFNEPALNTFDEATARMHEVPPWKIERTIEVSFLPLAEILAAHMPTGVGIDFLSVDVEGRDFDVLSSNDWQAFRPRVVLAESLGKSLDGFAADPAAALLRSLGYVPYAKTVNTFMFVDGES